MNAEAAEVGAAGSRDRPDPVAFDAAAARRAFEPELERLDLLIHREILRLRVRYQLTLDEFRGLYVSDRRVEDLLRSSNSGLAQKSLEAIEARLATAQAAIAAGDGVDSPWQRLWRSLALSRIERDLLLIALAPELSAKYEPLYAYLNNDVSRKLPTVDLAARLLSTDAVGAVELRGHAGQVGRLGAIGILECGAGSRELPRAQRGLRVAAPVADWLLGLPYKDERLAGIAEWDDPQLPRTPVHDTRVRAAVQALRRGFTGGIICIASHVDEACAVARHTATLAGTGSLRIDISALRWVAAPLEACAAINLAARLFESSVVAAPVDALVDADGKTTDAALSIARRLQRDSTRLIWAASTAARWRDVFAGGPENVPQPLLVHDLTVAQRADEWRAVFGHGLAARDVQSLADRFVFGTARIGQVRHALERRAALEGEAPGSVGQVFDAARAVAAAHTAGTTRTISTQLHWDDLVLPDTVKRQLLDYVSAVELREKVLDEWGLGKRFPDARNITLLLKGVSGGGKTLSARLIAKTLGLDLHRIELAGVVSKYIGETEKNLDRAFDAAWRASAILFIDEADALFGKRSEVKDAHDRYANVETAYLLQKIEDHDGLVILATNLANNIDEAFLRRMRYIIEIPMPDAPSRERLWSDMLGKSAPLGTDVDIPFLARQFVFAGGDIRNVVLDAAYLAAQQGSSIGMRQLLIAVARQFAKRGKVPTTAEFREYYPLLSLALPAAPGGAPA